ncbi:Protein phosphatase 2C family protein [Arabidopsis thaliana]|uniref:Putative protein phosphatase 2C-like protein 45 n=1 Tax=Arabidopsis thaliana TaxID=3702 RepID=P2C45_ARATH|nr:Protein phosphatase 2C family protein [Arabidopsis thaliana]Q3EAZ3.1 PUTATIVE PSEUDOGENE: RecName: Full=Putative protein phosphatase 2C-like protein 45; Short=AtPP2C45; AltName: Full=Protein phosphatase AP2C6 [Arabidopsis thaliana]AEE77272.1 Protein phosphatase 2C family protein [Arabidopsis thaliana]|eukprot:NP_189350.2 Protein phosphatase 2C family protein [Arabidopsis thaliana]
MEDRFSTITNLHGDRKQAIFGVYVGHGGVKAAECPAKNLDKNIVEEVVGKRHELEIAEAGGSSCVTALVSEGSLVVSNAGDCRAVMSVGGVAKGSLVVPRGIGDAQLKKWVIAEPETKISRVEHDHEFLILASHGLWDKVSNQEAVDIARPFCLRTEKPLLLAACKKLVDLSASRGSFDDISVMLIPLRPVRIEKRGILEDVSSSKANSIARDIAISVTRDGRFRSYLARGGPGWLLSRIEEDKR